MPRPCVICGHEVSSLPSGPPNQPRFECPVCGTYRLAEYAAQRIYEVVFFGGRTTPALFDKHHLLSASIRNQFEVSGGQEVYIETLDQLLASSRPPASPFESVDRILIHVSRKSERAGAEVSLRPSVDYPVAVAKDPEEFEYFIQLAEQLGLLATRRSDGNAQIGVRFLPRGWERLLQLTPHQPDLRRAFVAMALNAEMLPIFDNGFAPALQDLGLEVVLVSRIEHNEKIDDRIIVEIRRSGLVVADFTGQRQNVYFEAGFAMGLGRYLVFACRAGAEADLHFDIRQYDHVVWNDAADLRRKLHDRIAATIPGLSPPFTSG